MDDKRIAVNVEMPHMSCLADSIPEKVTYVPTDRSRHFKFSASGIDSNHRLRFLLLSPPGMSSNMAPACSVPKLAEVAGMSFSFGTKTPI